jgi:hypothetical protein
MSYNPTSVNGDGNWLDASSTSNRYIRTYIKGFVDVSGGNVIIRPGNHLFLKGGDISLNGNIYANYPTGSIPVSAISGLNGAGTTSLNSIALVNTVAELTTFTDNSFALFKPNPQYGTGTVTFQTSDLSLNGNLRIGGNLITSIVQLGPLSVTGTAPIVTPQTDTEGFSVCAVNTNQQTFTYAANDLSVNGNLFVRSFGRDLSMNGNVSLGGNLLVNGNLSVNQFQSTTKITTTNYQLVVAEDLSLNGRLNVTQDASLNGNVYVKGNVGIGGSMVLFGSITSTGNAPQLTQYAYAGSGTYNVPAGCRYLWVRAVGGGGAGGNASSAGNSVIAGAVGGTGGNTTFGPTGNTGLITANGGYGGGNSNSAGSISGFTNNYSVGGGGSGPSGSIVINGSPGRVYDTSTPSMTMSHAGGNSALGFGSYNGGNINGAYGGGGAGGYGANGAAYPGYGGGGGGYVESIISYPVSSYSYTIGAGGVQGATAPITGYGYGSAGGAGMLLIYAFF